MSAEIKPNDQLVIPESKPMIDNYHQLEFHVNEIDKMLEKPDVKKIFGIYLSRIRMRENPISSDLLSVLSDGSLLSKNVLK